MTASYSVYWIAHKNHTDIFTQGYIGITYRFERRMKEHNWSRTNKHLNNAINKYGWDNLVKKVLLVSDKEYCIQMEKELRSEDKIGWNIVKGGGIPPVNRWNLGTKGLMTSWLKGKKLSEETKKKVSESVKKLWENPEYRKYMSDAHKGKHSGRLGQINSVEHRLKISLSKIGKPSARKGQKLSEEQRMKMKELAIKESWVCPHCHKSGKAKGAGNRWHFNNCKSLGETL